MSVVARNKAPLVFADVVHFTTHVIVATDYIDLVLEQKTLVGYSKLVHGVKILPRFGSSIEEMNFSISVRVLTSNQDDLVRRDR